LGARGDGLTELIRETDDLSLRKFNDQNEFDIEVDPGVIWEDLNEFNTN
jgi:hypothetical protein